MVHLTVVGGTVKPPFTMNSHGIAQYKLASRYAARRIVESYAFPDEGKPKITMPSPAKELVYEYQRKGRLEETLARAIEKFAEAREGESAYDKGRRSSVLRAAKHLKAFGPKLAFQEVRQRTYYTHISGLRVRVSLDFLATLLVKREPQNVGVIYNVAADISDHLDKLKTHAQIESEIALRVLRERMPNLAAVWYIDLFGEKIFKKQEKLSSGVWREIETVCDDILIAYRTLIARRSRGNLKAT